VNTGTNREVHESRELYLEASFPKGDINSIFDELFALLPIRLLSSLNISTELLPKFNLRPILTNASSLRHLMISPLNFGQVAELLLYIPGEDVTAPVLQTLVFTYPDHDSELYEDYVNSGDLYPTSGLEELFKCIIERRVHGCPLRQIIFDKFGKASFTSFAQWSMIEDAGIELLFNEASVA